MISVNKNLVAGIFIILIVILLIYYRDVRLHEDILTGMWIADDKFCEDAGVDSMLVYIGAADGGMTTTRNGYIVIGPDVANQGFVMKYTPIYSPLDHTVTMTIDFDIDQLWPQDVSLRIDAATGSMRIYNGDKLYARLYRENILSDVLRAN